MNRIITNEGVREVTSPTRAVAKLLHPTLGIMRGVGAEPNDKLLNISVGELREIDGTLRNLDNECERAWKAYRIAHDQAMHNGEALAAVRADLAAMRGEA